MTYIDSPAPGREGEKKKHVMMIMSVLSETFRAGGATGQVSVEDLNCPFTKYSAKCLDKGKSK